MADHPDRPGEAPSEARTADADLPTVTVVVVNLDGREYLDRCLPSIRALDYPEDLVEVILIDNASRDGSAAHVAATYPEVRLVRNDSNVGFAPAVNQAARMAGGSYLALLNNDAAADPGWLREAVNVLDSSPTVACVASKILTEDGSTIEFAGGQATFYGHGIPERYGIPDDPGDQRVRPTLFASGGAMIVDRGVYLDAGGFDDDYFAFFEDVDFGWRLWLMGHEVRFVPTSSVRHRHHGTIARFGYARERYLLERNALMTITKNFADDRLAKVLPASLTLAMLRGFDEGGIELPDFTIRPDTSGEVPDTVVPALTAAHLAAVQDWARGLETTSAKRARIQARRARTDRELLRLFEAARRSNIQHPGYLVAFEAVMEAFGLNDAARPRSTVMIITEDTIAPKMAGPAIRAWEMARVLAHTHEVVLASTEPIGLSDPSFRTAQIDTATLPPLLAEAEVVIVQGFVTHHFPEVLGDDHALVVDCYDPFHLEGITLRKHEPRIEREATVDSDVAVLTAQLMRADFVVCASEKQRDFWLGQLSSIGRVNPATFDRDPSLRSLIDVAPFGLPEVPAVQKRSGIRGQVPGIGSDDLVLIWGGGIYNWFDPLTLIRAVAQVAVDRPRVKLFFMGSAHPNPNVPQMAMAATAHSLAAELGVLDSHVVFNDGWVAYDERADYLLDADIGVSTHFEHVETAYSYRTRLLDYLWCRLPVLCTSGDSLARLVEAEGLGLTVPPEDVEALAAALVQLHDDADLRRACADRIDALAPEMSWHRTLLKVHDFCERPLPAPDRHLPHQPYVADGGAHLHARNAPRGARAVARRAAGLARRALRG